MGNLITVNCPTCRGSGLVYRPADGDAHPPCGGARHALAAPVLGIRMCDCGDPWYRRECPDCAGSGDRETGLAHCVNCDGSGKAELEDCTCDPCRERGHSRTVDCWQCEGSGVVDAETGEVRA